jgi:hypothetical protein
MLIDGKAIAAGNCNSDLHEIHPNKKGQGARNIRFVPGLQCVWSAKIIVTADHC